MADKKSIAYREKIERKILLLMENKLQAGEMDAQRAKEIARFVLDNLKETMTHDEIYQTVKTFDDHFPELIPIVTTTVKEHIEELRIVVAVEVGKLLKQRKLEEAKVLLDKAISSHYKI